MKCLCQKRKIQSLFAGLLPRLSRKRRVNADPWHQLYSQRDYYDALMDGEHGSTFPKRQQSAGCARMGYAG